MKDKYYTPEIEEFHVGFEYERCDDGYKWFLDVYPRAAEHIKLENFLSYTRVKYLDREDIESLGFKLVWNEYGEIIFKKDKYRIFYNTRWEKDKVTILGNVDDETPFTDCPVLFTGEIKNKSELKRVLKQIGYGE